MLNQWENWCRLCGIENGTQIDVFIKDENFFNISDVIQKFLSITINISDEIPHRICAVCHEFVISMLNFFEKATKIQDMFTQIQLDASIDLKALRIKYNLPQEIEKLLVEVDEKPLVKLSELSDLSINTIENNLDFSKQIITKGSSKKRNIKKSIVAVKKPKLHVKTNSVDCAKTDDKEIIFKQEEFNVNDNNFQQNETNISVNTIESRKHKLEEKNPSLEKEKSKNYCDICSKKFSRQNGYRIHMKFKHSVVIPKNTYPCNECGKIFPKMQNYTEHQKLHLPPEERIRYPCQHCDQKFSALASVNVHIRSVHEKLRTFICEVCGNSCATNSLLQKHKLVHTNLKPFQCSKCPNSFKCARALKRHFEIHEDTKFICSLCGVTLNTKKNLQHHMVIHSDEKKYKCNYCEKEFKRSKTLKYHLILHTNLRPYECPFCDQSFANGSNCRKHQKLSHPTELAEMDKSGEKKICKIPNLEQLKAMTIHIKNNESTTKYKS